MEKNGIKGRQKFGKNQGEVTITSTVLLRKHTCHHYGQFLSPQSNLLKHGDKHSREVILILKIKEWTFYPKSQRESVSFKSRSSERPSRNTDFPFWNNELRTVGALSIWIDYDPFEHARMLFTIFPSLSHELNFSDQFPWRLQKCRLLFLMQLVQVCLISLQPTMPERQEQTRWTSVAVSEPFHCN